MKKLKISSSNGTEFYSVKPTFSYSELKNIIDQMMFSTITISVVDVPYPITRPGQTEPVSLIEIEKEGEKKPCRN